MTPTWTANIKSKAPTSKIKEERPYEELAKLATFEVNCTKRTIIQEAVKAEIFPGRTYEEINKLRLRKAYVDLLQQIRAGILSPSRTALDGMGTVSDPQHLIPSEDDPSGQTTPGGQDPTARDELVIPPGITLRKLSVTLQKLETKHVDSQDPSNEEVGTVPSVHGFPNSNSERDNNTNEEEPGAILMGPSSNDPEDPDDPDDPSDNDSEPSSDPSESSDSEEPRVAVDNIFNNLLEPFTTRPYVYRERRAPPARPVNRRVRKRREFAATQKKWRKDRGRTVLEILAGTDPLTTPPLPQSTKEFWTNLFSRPSPPTPPPPNLNQGWGDWLIDWCWNCLASNSKGHWRRNKLILNTLT